LSIQTFLTKLFYTFRDRMLSLLHQHRMFKFSRWHNSYHYQLAVPL